MKKKRLLKKVNYYYITDEKSDISVEEQVRVAVDNGVKMIQYRDKSANDRAKLEDVKKMKETCEEKALVVVNDRPDIAIAGGADGVHLGQDDIPPEKVKDLSEDLLIGISTHGVEQAKKAEKQAHYIAIGPVHKTTTKEDVAPELGIEKATDIADSVTVPTAAIGGIGPGDIENLRPSFDMICAISSVTQKGDLSERISYFEEKISNVKGRKDG